MNETSWSYDWGDAPPVDLPLLREADRRVAGIALLVGQLRLVLRQQHYSPLTEKAYVAWLRRFVAFAEMRHPLDVGRGVVVRFLARLGRGRVSASTQNQAASALSFVFGQLVGRPLLELEPFVRGRLPRRAPTVLTPEEVAAILAQLGEPVRLLAALLYGSGLRLSEACRLRVCDVDLERRQLVVHAGKGEKDRRTLLPERLVESLQAQLATARECHDADLAAGIASASARAPGGLWVFPGRRLRVDRQRGSLLRGHIHPNAVQREVARAVRAAGLAKHATCHSFRHSFATQLLEAGTHVRVIQELLGHTDVATTLQYAHRPASTRGGSVRSPLDGRRPPAGAREPQTRDTRRPVDARGWADAGGPGDTRGPGGDGDA